MHAVEGREREPTYHILLCMSSPHSYSPLSSSLEDLRAKNGKMKPSRSLAPRLRCCGSNSSSSTFFFLISIVNEGDCSWTFLHELTRLFASCLSFTFTFLRVCVLNSFHSFVCVSYVVRREPIQLSQSHFVQNKRLEDDVAYILHVFVCGRVYVLFVATGQSFSIIYQFKPVQVHYCMNLSTHPLAHHHWINTRNGTKTERKNGRRRMHNLE